MKLYQNIDFSGDNHRDLLIIDWEKHDNLNKKMMELLEECNAKDKLNSFATLYMLNSCMSLDFSALVNNLPIIYIGRKR